MWCMGAHRHKVFVQLYKCLVNINCNKDGTGNNGIGCMGHVNNWWSLHQMYGVHKY